MDVYLRQVRLWQGLWSHGLTHGHTTLSEWALGQRLWSILWETEKREHKLQKPIRVKMRAAHREYYVNMLLVLLQLLRRTQGSLRERFIQAIMIAGQSCEEQLYFSVRISFLWIDWALEVPKQHGMSSWRHANLAFFRVANLLVRSYLTGLAGWHVGCIRHRLLMVMVSLIALLTRLLNWPPMRHTTGKRLREKNTHV